MNVRRVVCLTAVLALTACSGGTEAAEPDPDQYLEEVRDIGGGMFEPIADDILLNTGDKMCQLSRGADSSDEYTDALFGAFAAADDMTDELMLAYTAQSGLALTYLCPEQGDRWGN